MDRTDEMTHPSMTTPVVADARNQVRTVRHFLYAATSHWPGHGTLWSVVGQSAAQVVCEADMGEQCGTLAGLTALITGGGRGIGRAIALAFVGEGASVAVAARTVQEIEAVATECRQFGDAFAIPLDVTDGSSCQRAVSACLERWGHLDILVNNAGIATSSKFVEIDDASWERTLAVDLTGPFYLMRAAIPHMLERGTGAVIAINSIAGKQGAPYIAAYCAAKHGLVGLMRSLSAEFARSGVTFNCICPAYVDTPMTQEAIQNIVQATGRTRERALSALLTPQGRLIQPEEIAALCVLLAGPEGRSINGQAINIDGGQVQW